MIPRFSLLALVLAASFPAFAQEDSKEVPPANDAPFAGKAIDQMTADEVLKLVRASYTLYNRDFTGNLIMGITKKVPFLLSLKTDSIRFIFDNPAQVIYLDTRNQRFGLFEGVGGAEMQPVPPAKFGEKVRGTDITYDDLSMRFLYWPNARIVRQEKVKGRDCILLSIRNPDGAGAYSSVDVWIDKLSGGMIKMIGNDHGGRPIRRFEVLSGKKFDDIWMVDEMRIESVTGLTGGTVTSSTRMQIKSTVGN
ncbi:MAG: outer membrane lipoprotein-sorting protein [Verrucomicrobiales bacterium]|nr:outer membrane lipoprotein-sorting protein [Verrucomicrobiales bacterium]